MSNTAPQIIPQRDRPVYSLQWSEGEQSVTWANLSFAAKIDGHWLEAADFASFSWRQDARKRWVLNLSTDKRQKISLVIEPRADSPSVLLHASFQTTPSCQLGGFKIITSTGDDRAMPLAQGDGIWTVYSDDFTALGMSNLARIESDDPIDQGCWIASVQNPALKQTFAFAQLTAEQWPVWFEAKREGRSVEMTARAGGEKDEESITVAVGATITADPLLVGLWQGEPPQEVLLNIAGLIAQNVHRRRPRRLVQKGWSTWHYFFRKITGENLLEQSRAVRGTLFDEGFRIIQIDGGWWAYPGEFTANPAKFPNGLAEFSEKIRQQGFEFGVHMSPFRLALASPFWQEHPADWNVGANLKPQEGERPMAVFDGSHPDVVEYLKNTYAQLARDCHITYYKFDFINQGAKEGVRHNPAMTGLQSFNALIRGICSALPDDIVLCGCNTPSLASVECFDNVRIGPDINHGPPLGPNGEYANMEWGEPVAFIPKPNQWGMTLMNQVRALARQFYFWKIAYLDADSAMATPAYTDDEVKCHVTLVALTGGAYFLGDRIDTLPKERVALLTNPDLMAIWQEGKAAMPLDLFAGIECPRIWKVDLAGREVVAIYNWMPEESRDNWTLEDLWLDPQTQYRVREIWSGEKIELNNGKIELVQPPHSVRLLEFVK